MTVYNFGSINIDHVYRVPHLVQPGETLASHAYGSVLGGKGANQSVALARAGARVCHVGRLSASDDWAVALMAESGVDVSRIERIDGASGHAIIQVDDAGENAIVLYAGANGGFTEASVHAALDAAAADDWLLLQNECNANAWAMSAAIERGLRIAINPAPMQPDIAALPLSACHLLILNEGEALALSEESSIAAAADVLEQRYPDTRVVLTLGARGAQLLKAGERCQVDATPVDTVDTTGAGDTFVGYLIAGLIAGRDAEAALNLACAAGALAVTREGAVPGIPTLGEVDEFMRAAS